ncbi:16S rRNA (uracil(1498)-N(3))-methyltransferase [Pediococcus pentosaceus]|uniref:16S rRNA (uracil(1498)-N(3))-methyltransferase n=1 Tax=Pediococcus pentosaceus TaxID=1255 RepID=UPI00201BE071|nr:16S rRNA (uracil(1498)-N(3))-methyltransferase [Pediococcus pentosaceus]MDQ7251815.1 16S rRNA (uracil(1498)-N(3))-methyltransferase [Pediococcus pentosaceus]
MQRYFVKQPLKIQTELQLSKEDSHHLIRVMRTDIGRDVEVVDLDGKVFIAEVLKSGSIATLRTKEDITKSVELPVDITIACGISKGDKNEQIIKRGTEMGAKHFIFFESRYSVARWSEPKAEKKLKRLREIAKGASEQSHRQLIPTVAFIKAPALFETTIEHRMVAYEESAKQDEHANFKSLLLQLKAGDQLLAVFGPEGGFAEEEIQEFTEHQFVLAGLGPRILRAETAPMYLLSAVSYQFELK